MSRTGWQSLDPRGKARRRSCLSGLADEEQLALVADLKRTITDDRYPLSPRIRALQAILDKLPAAGPCQHS